MSDLTTFLTTWADAERDGDAATTDRLLTDDFIGIGPVGFQLPKQAWLHRQTGGDLNYDSLSLDEVTNREYGDCAVTTARWNAKGTTRGNPIPEATRATLVSVKIGGEWQLATIHFSFIADSVGAAPRSAGIVVSAVTATDLGTGTRRRFGRRTRNVVLAIHIVVSVGLLGDSAGFLAVAIRRAMSDDPTFVDNSRDILGTFALFFGIPLSFLALLTGIALGLGTPWGVLRHPWVVAKLVLIVSVIVVGATILRPVLDDDGNPGSTPLIAGAAYDVAALSAATVLAVFKPGRTKRV